MLIVAAALMLSLASEDLPELVVRADDTRVERSCRLVVPEGLVIADANGDGVVHVVADGVRVEFALGSVLRGAADVTDPDGFGGVGIRVEGRSDVSIAGARVTADGAVVIDNWTWHAPARDEGVLELAEARTVELAVEHFELDGHAVLTLELEPAD